MWYSFSRKFQDGRRTQARAEAGKQVKINIVLVLVLLDSSNSHHMEGTNDRTSSYSSSETNERRVSRRDRRSARQTFQLIFRQIIFVYWKDNKH